MPFPSDPPYPVASLPPLLAHPYRVMFLVSLAPICKLTRCGRFQWQEYGAKGSPAEHCMHRRQQFYKSGTHFCCHNASCQSWAVCGIGLVQGRPKVLYLLSETPSQDDQLSLFLLQKCEDNICGKGVWILPSGSKYACLVMGVL